LSSSISTHTDTPRSDLGISFGPGGAVTVRGPGQATGALTALPADHAAKYGDFDFELF